MCSSERSDSASSTKAQLLLLLKRLSARELEVGVFCEEFEQLWNFERNPGDLDTETAELLRRVFDVAVWYSPDLEERRRIPGYKDEQAVRNIVETTLEQLRHW